MPKKKTNEKFLQEVYDLVGDEYIFLENYINASTKIKLIHKICEYEYEVTPNHFLQGRRCPKCAGNKKKTDDQFKKEIYELVRNEYYILDNYKNATTKLRIKHNVCNSIYEIEPVYFLGGRRCPYCAGNKKKTDKQFKREVYELVGDEYTILGQYINSKSRILINHNICNTKYEITPSSFLSGINRCLFCNNKTKDNKYFVNEVYNLVKDQYTFLEKYIDAKTPILVRHNLCNFEYKVSPNNFLSKRTKCPNCMGNLKKTNDQFITEIYNLVGNEYIFLENYINTMTKIKVLHKKCNKEYKIRPYNFIHNSQSRCPFCAKTNFSRKEKDLLNFVKMILPNEKIIENDRNILEKKEIDIFIPSKNIGIEFNGLYWHSSKFKNENFHLNKTMLAKSKNIQLIHIFEDEWIDQKDIIKDRLLSILKNDCDKISNKNYKIKKETDDSFDKKNEHDIIFCYKIYLEKELIETISFRKEDVGIYELLNYTNKNKFIDSFDKLLKYCIKKEDMSEIYTYVDLRWIDLNNNIFLENDFQYITTTKPNYWYIVNSTRQLFSKMELKEQMELELKYYKIYDCGNALYRLKIKEV